MRYRPELPLVLNNLNMYIVGIVISVYLRLLTLCSVPAKTLALLVARELARVLYSLVCCES